MTSTFGQRVIFLAALSVGSAIQAAPATLSAGQVSIDYDTDGFSFARETTSFGGVTSESISPASLSVTAVGNGVELNFNDQLSVYATSYTYFYPQTLSGNFNAFFNFTPGAGYAITGYTLTYTGSYSIETPGSVYLGDTTGTFLSEYTGGGGFLRSTSTAGPFAPAVQGSFSATGDLTTIQVFDGVDTYIDHYEDVLDYCETEDPAICYYHQEPIYISQPIYHDETDLGEASISIQKVTLTANVVAVPEPESLALLAMGVPLAAWRACRRRRAA